MNFDGELQFLEEWIVKPNSGEYYTETATTKNTNEGNPNIPRLLRRNNIIEEFANGKSRFPKPYKQLQKKKRNPNFKIWSKKNKNKEKNIKRSCTTTQYQRR